jgi:FAD:protein FMN transferase
MGSTVHLIVVDGSPRLIDVARRRIEELERRWSRFVPASEVNALNRCAGTFVPVSSDTVLLVRQALDGWACSQGWFDPTVLGAVIRAGYDRSFDRFEPHPVAGHSVWRTGAGRIQLGDDRVCIPRGVGFDPGGIGKGLAADLVASELTSRGAGGVCVNMGGDVHVTGSGPTGAAWTIAVEHPWSAEPIASLGVADGAVATSTTLKRRWEVDGQARHHLIDPFTGQSSETDLNEVTVVAAETWRAEVLAKAVLLRGSHGFGLAEAAGAQVLAVDRHGRVSGTSGLAAYLGDALVPEKIRPVSEGQRR